MNFFNDQHCVPFLFDGPTASNTLAWQVDGGERFRKFETGRLGTVARNDGCFRGPWSMGYLDLIDYFPPVAQAF